MYCGMKDTVSPWPPVQLWMCLSLWRFRPPWSRSWFRGVAPGLRVPGIQRDGLRVGFPRVPGLRLSSSVCEAPSALLVAPQCPVARRAARLQCWGFWAVRSFLLLLGGCWGVLAAQLAKRLSVARVMIPLAGVEPSSPGGSLLSGKPACPSGSVSAPTLNVEGLSRFGPSGGCGVGSASDVRRGSCCRVSSHAGSRSPCVF